MPISLHIRRLSHTDMAIFNEHDSFTFPLSLLHLVISFQLFHVWLNLKGRTTLLDLGKLNKNMITPISLGNLGDVFLFYFVLIETFIKFERSWLKKENLGKMKSVHPIQNFSIFVNTI